MKKVQRKEGEFKFDKVIGSIQSVGITALSRWAVMTVRVFY